MGLILQIKFRRNMEIPRITMEISEKYPDLKSDKNAVHER